MSSPEARWDYLASECPWRRFICETILQEEETRCIAIPEGGGTTKGLQYRYVRPLVLYIGGSISRVKRVGPYL